MSAALLSLLLTIIGPNCLDEPTRPDCVLQLADPLPADADCDRMWVVRIKYLYVPNIWPGNEYWLSHEVGPLTASRAEADARRREIERDGYTFPPMPDCAADPSQCSEVHVAPSHIAFASVKRLCCGPAGHPWFNCRYEGTLPPPAP